VDYRLERIDEAAPIYFLTEESTLSRLLLIWFHGGGLVNLSRTSIKFAEDLTKAGVGVASVEYRMYTHGAQFPDFLVDCANAVKFLQDHIHTYANPRRIFLSGQSAGAWLTLMLAFDKHYLMDAGVDFDTIAGFISDSAQITTHFSVLSERGVDYRLERIDEAAPIYFLTEESTLSRLLLISYDEDMPCRPEQNQLMYKSIRRICPQMDVTLKMLPGGHCNGSGARNEKGTFDFNDALLEFLNS
jgi:hypothetical protein